MKHLILLIAGGFLLLAPSCEVHQSPRRAVAEEEAATPLKKAPEAETSAPIEAVKTLPSQTRATYYTLARSMCDEAEDRIACARKFLECYLDTAGRFADIEKCAEGVQP